MDKHSRTSSLPRTPLTGNTLENHIVGQLRLQRQIQSFIAADRRMTNEASALSLGGGSPPEIHFTGDHHITGLSMRGRFRRIPVLARSTWLNRWTNYRPAVLITETGQNRNILWQGTSMQSTSPCTGIWKSEQFGISCDLHSDENNACLT